MTRRTILMILGVIWYFSCTYVTASDGRMVDLDMRDILQEITLDVAEEGDQENIAKSLIEGDLYSRSYARAELGFVRPIVESIDMTHAYIDTYCEDSLAPEDVNNVFAESRLGQQVFSYLGAREAVAYIGENENYAGSCSRVVACYYGEDLDTVGYTNKVRDLCDTIVSTNFLNMYKLTQGFQDIQDVNYGDEFLANADPTDGPFDLLKDIEHIGGLLFTHQDPASEIHFYTPQEPGQYIDNDPDKATTYDTAPPHREDDAENKRRFEATSGLDPWSPETLFEDNLPDQASDYIPREDNTQQQSTALHEKLLAEAAYQLDQGATSTNSSLQNNALCTPELPPQPEQNNTQELADQEQQATHTYNTKLDTQVRVSLALGAMLSPEIEEKYGLDPKDVLAGTGIPPEDINTDSPMFDPDDMKGEHLETLREGLETCFDEYMDPSIHDVQTVGKAVWKNITQPTAFTQCVLQSLCFEIEDTSGRGLYRIRGCTVPSNKSYAVTNNQSVASVEEIIDEYANVCYALRESGQLLPHNKTKDALDQKLMNLDFADTFSFSLTVGFKPLKDTKDPAYEKRLQRENNAYLEKTLLGIYDELSHEQERNKYIIFDDATARAESYSVDSANQEAYKNAMFALANAPGDEVAQAEERSQLRMHEATIEVMDTFVEQNISYREAMNDTIASMTTSRQNEMKEAKKQH